MVWGFARRESGEAAGRRRRYLKVADNEYLFDIEYDPRERGDLSKKQPDLLAELRKQWEDWDRDMLPLPASAPISSNLSAMPW